VNNVTCRHHHFGRKRNLLVFTPAEREIRATKGSNWYCSDQPINKGAKLCVTLAAIIVSINEKVMRHNYFINFGLLGSLTATFLSLLLAARVMVL
jgi:hypothetical protein